jgi:hypothetical protein
MALFRARWFCLSISSGVFLRPKSHSSGMVLYKWLKFLLPTITVPMITYTLYRVVQLGQLYNDFATQ